MPNSDFMPVNPCSPNKWDCVYSCSLCEQDCHSIIEYKARLSQTIVVLEWLITYGPIGCREEDDTLSIVPWVQVKVLQSLLKQVKEAQSHG
jgi:hypothetical protein